MDKKEVKWLQEIRDVPYIAKSEDETDPNGFNEIEED